jgi:hypothetical protein
VNDEHLQRIFNFNKQLDDNEIKMQEELNELSKIELAQTATKLTVDNN